MDGEWSSLNGICSDEADFMAQLLGNCSLPNDVVNNNTNFTAWPSHESSDNVSQGSSGYSILFPFSSQESYYSTLSPHVPLTNNLMTVDGSQMGLVGGDDFLNQDVSNDSLESNNDVMSEDVINEGKKMGFMIPPQIPREEKITKKRSRAPCEAPRNKKMKCDENKSSNVVFHRQSSSSCCSEDESNASHEMNGTTSCSSSKGKTRASRGSATDPQSLYARKRRERINERLKILQTLVPNGTKVDISTMLEEAVEYVKFLQLQIKLLSSDDMWMYAPIAYNGMNIGLDVNVSALKPQS